MGARRFMTAAHNRLFGAFHQEESVLCQLSKLLNGRDLSRTSQITWADIKPSAMFPPPPALTQRCLHFVAIWIVWAQVIETTRSFTASNKWFATWKLLASEWKLQGRLINVICTRNAVLLANNDIGFVNENANRRDDCEACYCWLVADARRAVQSSVLQRIIKSTNGLDLIAASASICGRAA